MPRIKTRPAQFTESEPKGVAGPFYLKFSDDRNTTLDKSNQNKSTLTQRDIDASRFYKRSVFNRPAASVLHEGGNWYATVRGNGAGSVRHTGFGTRDEAVTYIKKWARRRFRVPVTEG